MDGFNKNQIKKANTINIGKNIPDGNVFEKKQVSDDKFSEVNGFEIIDELNVIQTDQKKKSLKKKNEPDINAQVLEKLKKGSVKVIREVKDVKPVKTSKSDMAQTAIEYYHQTLENAEDEIFDGYQGTPLTKTRYSSVSYFKKKKRVDEALKRVSYVSKVEAARPALNSGEPEYERIDDIEVLLSKIESFRKLPDKEYSLDKDDKFVKNLPANIKLVKAAEVIKKHLSDAEEDGLLPEEIDIADVRDKIAHYEELKEYLNVRMEIMTSPYYIYCRHSDVNYTEGQLKHFIEGFENKDKAFQDRNRDVIKYLKSVQTLRNLDFVKKRGMVSVPEDKIEAKAKKEETEDKERFLKAEENRHEEKKQEEKQEEKAVEEEKKEEKKQEQSAAAYKKSNILPAKLSVLPRWKENERPTKERFDEVMGPVAMKKELTAYLDSMNNSEFVKNFVNKPAEEKALKERISSAYALIMKGKTPNEDQVNRAYADALNKLAMQKHLIEENTNLLKRREDERSLVMRCLNNDILDNYERRFTTVSDKEAINLLMMGKNHRGGDEILTNNISDLDLDTQKEISEFKFEDYIYKTDEEFISSYAEKYDKLCKMAKFDVLIDKRDDRVTYGTYLKTNMRIRSDFAKLYKEHYEDKLKLMSSPYYALIPQDELKGFLDKNGNSKIARIKDPALADFLRTYRKVELGKPSLSKKSQTFKDIVANGCDVQMKKDCATVKRYMKIAEEGQKIAKKSGDKDYQFTSENKEDNLLKLYRQHQELVKSREIKEDVEFVNSRIYGESEQPFMKNSAETLDKLEKTIMSFITKGEIYGVKLRLEDRPGLERLIKKWVAKRRIAIRANDASLFCIPMAFGLGCDFNNDDFAETKEGEWLKKFKAGSKPEEISKDLNEKRRAYAEATTEIYKFLHTNGYPMSPDRKYEKRLQDKEKIKEIVERGDYPVITVNGVEITSYNYKKSALTHMAKLGKEYRFEGEDGERITELLKECSDIEQRRLVLHTMYGDVGGEKNLIYVIGMREITAEEIRVKTELFPLLTGKVEGIEEAVSERVKAAIEKKQKGEKEKDIEKQKIEQEFTVITEEEVNREEIDRILLNKPLLDTGILSPARAKDLKSDASFVEIMKPGEFIYVVREGTEEISEAAAAKTVSNADGSFVIDGLAINRLAMNLRCSPGEGRSNKEIISILKRLDAKQNMTDNKLTKEEADKQFSDAMYELKHIYYIHLKRLENTYGKKLSQMHPYDVLRMLGDDYSKLDTDFSIMQDTIQMLECGRFFDMNKKEDKEFSRLAYYYNTVFSNNIKKFGMDFASNELSGEKMYVYSDKDRSDRGELNEKGMEDYHFMTDKDIGGASLTKKEQKEYIKDLRKRAREEGWDDKLFGRYLDPKARIINKNIIDLNNHASVRVANDALNAQFEGEKVSEADMKKMQEVVKASYEFKRSLASSVPKDTYKTFCNKGKNKKLKGINYKGILTLMRPIKLDKDGYPLNKDEETKIALNNNDLYFLTLDDMEQRKPFLDRIAGEARDLCFTVDQLRDPAYILKNKTRAIRHLAFMHNAREVYESNSSYYQKDADPAYGDFMSKLMNETNYVEYSSFRIQQALFGNGLELSYTGGDPIVAYTVKFKKGKGKSYEDIKKQNESLSKADRKYEEEKIRKLVDPFKKKGAAKL